MYRRAQVSERDINIICGDAGVKGGYIAGVLAGLIEVIPEHFNRVSSLYACSASAASVSYYLSHGHGHPGRQLWTKEMAQIEFIRFSGAISFFSNGQIYDLNALVQGLMKKRYPLDIDRILENPINFFCPVFDLIQGRVRYFTNRTRAAEADSARFIDLRSVDYYDAIRAAVAAPILYDAPISIGGSLFCDAGFTEPYVLASPDGFIGKRLLIVTQLGQTPLEAISYHALGYCKSLYSMATRTGLGAKVYLSVAHKSHTLSKLRRMALAEQAAGRLLIFEPPSSLGSSFDVSETTMTANFELGFNQAIDQREQLLTYLDC
jgi:predicted patatin/cPLA2 family phospholipase